MPVKLQGGGDDHEEEARIEIIPLIDIMFFLLASFMLASLAMTQIHRVKVNLPVASSAARENKVPPVHLAIDAHGVVTWDMDIVTPSEITGRLQALAGGDDMRVLIAADGDSRHSQVLAVYDAVLAAGIDKVGLETRKPAP